ncbi:MAG: hypothetical protein AAF809_08635 [Bacteroidota bacterium]
MESVDPRTLLYSMPTLAGDVPSLEPVETAPVASDLLMHEDDWAQLGFFAAERLEELQRVLRAYTPFEAQHRRSQGWAEIFMRKIERSPIFAEPVSLSELEACLEASVGPAPLLFWSGGIAGRVEAGFSLELGSKVSLYGYTRVGQILVLGAHFGADPDQHRLVQAFMRLHARYGLIFVDWRAPMVLTGVTASGEVAVFQP